MLTLPPIGHVLCTGKLNVLLAALAVGPLGNLRHDSALMGAITKTKGKQALPERIPVISMPHVHCLNLL